MRIAAVTCPAGPTGGGRAAARRHHVGDVDPLGGDAELVLIAPAGPDALHVAGLVPAVAAFQGTRSNFMAALSVPVCFCIASWHDSLGITPLTWQTVWAGLSALQVSSKKYQVFSPKTLPGGYESSSMQA